MSYRRPTYSITRSIPSFDPFLPFSLLPSRSTMELSPIDRTARNSNPKKGIASSSFSSTHSHTVLIYTPEFAFPPSLNPSRSAISCREAPLHNPNIHIYIYIYPNPSSRHNSVPYTYTCTRTTISHEHEQYTIYNIQYTITTHQPITEKGGKSP